MNADLAHYHRAIENHRQAITESGRQLARTEASAAWARYLASQPKRTAPEPSRSYVDDRSGFGPTTSADGSMLPGNVSGSETVQPLAPTADDVHMGDVLEHCQGGDHWTSRILVRMPWDPSQCFGAVRHGIGYRITRKGRVVLSQVNGSIVYHS